jgi:hypothetical protein
LTLIFATLQLDEPAENPLLFLPRARTRLRFPWQAPEPLFALASSLLDEEIVE